MNYLTQAIFSQIKAKIISLIQFPLGEIVNNLILEVI